MTLAVNMATQPTPRVSTNRKDVPPALDDLVARAMAKDPRRDTRRLPSYTTRAREDARQDTVETPRRRRPHGARGPRVRRLADMAAVPASPAATPIPPTVAIPPVKTPARARPTWMSWPRSSSRSSRVTSRPFLKSRSCRGRCHLDQGNDVQDNPAGRQLDRRRKGAASGVGIAEDVDLIQKDDAQPLWQDHVGEADVCFDYHREGRERARSRLRGRPDDDEANRTRCDSADPGWRGASRVPEGPGGARHVGARRDGPGSRGPVRKRDQARCIIRVRACRFEFGVFSRSKHTREPSWLDGATNEAKQALAIDPLADQAHWRRRSASERLARRTTPCGTHEGPLT